MENFSTSVTPEHVIEKIEKDKVLEMLRLNGIEHSETMAMVVSWTKQQEALVVQEGTVEARIIFELERSDLYLAIGDTKGYLDCLEDARTQAYYENETELYDQITKKMNEVEASFEK